MPRWTNHNTINAGNATTKKKHFSIYVVVQKKKINVKLLERYVPKHLENSEIKFKLKPQIFLIGMIPENINEKHDNLFVESSKNQSGTTLEKGSLLTIQD